MTACDTCVMQPLSSVSVRSAYSFLLVLGTVWGIALLGFLALFSGFFGSAPPWHFVEKFLLWSSWLWIGPLLLALGAYWGLRGRHYRAGILSIWAGCFSLTAMVMYQLVSMLHDAADPLIMKPTFGLVAFQIIIALLALSADVIAFRLSWKTA